MKVIGLIGQKQSGKDTFYTLFKDLKPCSKRYAFADNVYKEIAEILVFDEIGLSDESLRDSKIEQIKQNKSFYRPLLQWWATEFKRGINENYWITSVINEIQASDRDFAVVTDVRFKNEYNALKDNFDCLFIKILRPISENSEDYHVSETEHLYLDADLVISNEGNLDDYKEKIIDYVKYNKWFDS